MIYLGVLRLKHAFAEGKNFSLENLHAETSPTNDTFAEFWPMFATKADWGSAVAALLYMNHV